MLRLNVQWILALLAVLPTASSAGTGSDPTWWSKYEYLAKYGPDPAAGSSTSTWSGANVDVSNECGPQSETYITLDPNRPKVLAAGSNEIYRLPMRGYFSADGGNTWGGVDLPLPPPTQGTHDTLFGSDPSLVFDTLGNAFYGYIVVYFGNGSGVKGTAMAVARSSDGGRTWPLPTLFSFETGSNHFNDKPMITADQNPRSPFRDSVYIAWTRLGRLDGRGHPAGALHQSRQQLPRDPRRRPLGPGQSIGAVPFVGPDGALYVAWNDYHANTIEVNSSFDGGSTWALQRTIAAKALAFDLGIPAESFRGALVYPACDTDRSNGPHRGRLYCSWMDLTPVGTANIFISWSDDRAATWSSPSPVPDALSFPVDRFNHWMSVDAATGDVNVSYYDTRNDKTGLRYQTDVYLSQSRDGGATSRRACASPTSPRTSTTAAASTRAPASTMATSRATTRGSSPWEEHPSIWTDSRLQLAASSGCRRPYLMEEVFTATVR